MLTSKIESSGPKITGTQRQRGSQGMTKSEFDRRDFLKSAVVGGAAAASGTAAMATGQTAQAAPPAAAPIAAETGYEFLNLNEAAFIEALVDHMVPADELTL